LHEIPLKLSEMAPWHNLWLVNFQLQYQILAEREVALMATWKWWCQLHRRPILSTV